jgi:hypothetical protein
MPNRKQIDPNFQPSERVYELLTPLLGTIERAREFCGQERDEFIMYWEGISGKQAAKSNWNSTFLNRMKQVYEYKKEAMARNREYGKSKPNLVQEVAAGLMAQDLEKPGKKPKPKYRFQPPPADTGERLSQDEAFAQLDAMFPGRRS